MRKTRKEPLYLRKVAGESLNLITFGQMTLILKKERKLVNMKKITVKNVKF